MYGFNKTEIRIFKKLDSPKKVQDFLDKLKMNFEPDGDTCRSPRVVLKKKEAHCIEGAMLAASALRFHGHRPFVVDMTAVDSDYDHVITVFKKDGFWGAISKTNHAVLRYREPVYVSIRELIMSYFHEYTDDKGRKTLRSYTNPIDLSMFDKIGWTISENDVWEIPNYLLEVPHKNILSRSQIASLRKADKIESDAGKILEWKE